MESFISFWIYNVTNVSYVFTGSEPIIDEIGPIVYSKHKEKVDISYNCNGTVSYNEKYTYYFNEEMSYASQYDLVTVINLVGGAILSITNSTDRHTRSSIEMLFDYPFKLNLFRTVNIHDYIWGYSDETLVKLNKQMYTTYPEVHGLIDKNLRNNSISERYEVWSGKKGTAIGDLVSYNYSRQLNYWNSENSNMLNGTDGSGWNPFVDKTRDLYIFDPELCRSISVQFDETALVRGIHTYQYKISPNIYQNPLKNRINVDFCKQNCLNGDINDKTNVNFCCTKTGNFNLMPCKMGEFVYSIPQYSQVDKFLRKSSIKPFEKTESWLKLEPVTGKVLCSQKQFTASLMIRNTHYVLYNGNEKINHSLLSDYAFPIYSLQERHCIDTKTAVMVAQIVFIVSYLEYIAYLLIVSGGAGLVSFAILTYRRSVNNRNIKIDTSSPIDLYSLTHVVQL